MHPHDFLDPGTLGVMIPIFAVVLGLGSGIVAIITKSQEKRLELRLRIMQEGKANSSEDMQSLRAEIAALRDTSTQFNMSLQHTVDRLEQRISYLESTRVASGFGPTPTSPAETQEQQIGLR